MFPEINGDFSRKSQIFPTPVYLSPPLSGFPLELGNTEWSQETAMMGLPGQAKSLTIYLTTWIQYTSVTDGRTSADNKHTSLTHIVAR